MEYKIYVQPDKKLIIRTNSTRYSKRLSKDKHVIYVTTLLCFNLSVYEYSCEPTWRFITAIEYFKYEGEPSIKIKKSESDLRRALKKILNCSLANTRTIADKLTNGRYKYKILWIPCTITSQMLDVIADLPGVEKVYVTGWQKTELVLWLKNRPMEIKIK